jgi:hypothetical protein
VIGTSVPFIFNTLDQYNNGVERDSWTRLIIKYRYSGTSGWELHLKASEDKFYFNGYDPLNVHDLDLDALEMDFDVTYVLDTPAILPASSASINPAFTLSNTWDVLASGNGGVTAQVDVEIVISYRFGYNPIMLGKPEGFYYVELEFLLVDVP